MKKWIILLTCLLALSGCAAEKTPPAGAEEPSDGTVYAGTVVDVSETSVLVAAAEGGELTRVSASLPLTGAETLAVGQRVEIAYNGTVMESYPVQLGEPTGIRVTGDDAGLLSMYRQAIAELWDSDSGLLTDMTVLGCDFSALTNLSEGERAGLIWALGEQYGLEPVSGTSEELAAQGYIDKENLIFSDGVLLKLAVTEEKTDRFTFDISLWRGGDGAVGHDGCKAKLKSGAWSYEVGDSWIS